jgi:hypothetical protein
MIHLHAETIEPLVETRILCAGKAQKKSPAIVWPGFFVLFANE